MAFRLSAGHRHEMTAFEQVLDAGKVKRAGRGRPKIRARCVRADRAYRGAKAHRCCQRRGMQWVVPPKRNHKRPRSYVRGRSRQRNVIERLMNRLKRSRRMATRFEKRACHFEAMVTLECLMEWL
jgi:transposase